MGPRRSEFLQTKLTEHASQLPHSSPRVFLVLAGTVWGVLYAMIAPVSATLVAALPIDHGSHLADAVEFFLYDTPKVLLLVTGVVFVMGMVNSHFTPDRTRALLAGRREGVGKVMAASLGIVTPFCSCSVVPLFIGFVRAGVPLGVTLSFLIAAPMVNEVALALLFGLFGLEDRAGLPGTGTRRRDRVGMGDRAPRDGAVSPFSRRAPRLGRSSRS